jgi:N-acetylmuramoyl-L-alanine amidase
MLAYYAVPTFESAGGRSLADRIAHEIEAAASQITGSTAALGVHGMRLPVLRETRMTAVLCSLGEVRPWIDRTPALTRAVVTALAIWMASPLVDTQR